VASATQKVHGILGWIQAKPELWMASARTGNKGNIQFVITQLPAGLPLETMNKAHLDQSQARIKTGEVAVVQEKEVGGVKGVLTIEAVKPGSLCRLQWIANDARGSFNFVFSSDAAVFEGYEEAYLKSLASVKFLDGKAPAAR